MPHAYPHPDLPHRTRASERHRIGRERRYKRRHGVRSDFNGCRVRTRCAWRHAGRYGALAYRAAGSRSHRASRGKAQKNPAQWPGMGRDMKSPAQWRGNPCYMKRGNSAIMTSAAALIVFSLTTSHPALGCRPYRSNRAPLRSQNKCTLRG